MSNYRLIDRDGLGKKLQAMRDVDFGRIFKNNLVQIYNRTRSMTPVSTEKTRPGGPHGELRLSADADLRDGFSGQVGYVKDYAPHVEFGHRTRDGGYVPGQRYLKKNVDIQKRILNSDVEKAVKNAK